MLRYVLLLSMMLGGVAAAAARLTGASDSARPLISDRSADVGRWVTWGRQQFERLPEFLRSADR